MLLGLLITIWYEFLFLTIWIISSIYTPLVVLSFVLPWIFYPPKVTCLKYYYLYTSIQYILFCQDKKKKKKTKTQKKSDDVVKDDTTSTTASATTTTASASATTKDTTSTDPAIYFPNYHSSINTNNDTTTTDTTTSDNAKITKKTVIFIRHGESTWNYTFNKGNERSTLQFIIYFIPNLFQTLFYEYYYYMTGQSTESLLYDAPLSHNGIRQAQTIQSFLQSVSLPFVTPKEKKYLTLLKGISDDTLTTDHNKNHNTNDTFYLVSNLRRAITTAGIAFYPQLTTHCRTTTTGNHNPSHQNSNTNPPLLWIVSALQEISTNPDALCISPSSSSSSSNPHTMVGSRSDPISIRRYIYGETTTTTGGHGSRSTTTNTSSNTGVMDTTYHDGNKSLSSTGQQRIQEFCQLLFHSQENHTTTNPNDQNKTTTDTATNMTTDISQAQNYIVTGHSLWFLTFFQQLLPWSCTHVAKKKKLQNGSIIGFTVLHTTTNGTEQQGRTDHYMIDPTSLVVVHGGF